MVGYVDVGWALNSNAKVRRGDCGLRNMVKIIYKILRDKTKHLIAERRTGGYLRVQEVIEGGIQGV